MTKDISKKNIITHLNVQELKIKLLGVKYLFASGQTTYVDNDATGGIIKVLVGQMDIRSMCF